MIVPSRAPDMERGTGCSGKCLESMVDQLEAERAGAFGMEWQVDHGVRSTADVDDRCRD
jgi:hypothetical protein